MPGVDLNLDLPTLSDTLATIVSKLVTAIAAIETDLAAQVVPSEIYVNQALAMNGAALVNVGSLQLVAGNSPTNAGAIYYSGGEFYAIDAAGTVQLTSGGALNVSAVGTIGGDFGGSNPAAVTYNDASGEFRFTQDVGVWADLVCRDITLHGTNGSVKLGVDDAINSARVFNVKSLPASGVSMLVYDGATSSVNDGTALRATNPLLVTDVDVFGNLNLEGGGDYKHLGTFEKQVPLGTGGTFLSTTFDGSKVTFVGTPWVYRSPFLDVRVGDRIDSFLVTVQRGGNSSTISAKLRVLAGNNTTPADVTGSTSSSTATSDFTQGPATLTPVVASGERYFIEVTGNVSTGHVLVSHSINWAHP